MTDFFDNLDPDAANEVDQLSRLLYELRENRALVLKQHDARDEDELLALIESGAAGEHPAYEHYLAARILYDTRETVRQILAERTQEVNRT